MLVGNFTPDTLKWEHVGQVGEIPPGEVKDFPDNRANHILTKSGPRGLLKVDWDKRDELDYYTEIAMGIYTRFWQLQLSVYNQQNEQRRNENKVYTFPTKQLQEKAEELNVELMEPWKTVRKTETGEMKDLRRKNEDLTTEIGDLKKDVAEMIRAMKEATTQKVAEAKPIIIDTASFLKQFNNLGKDRYQNWVIDNMNEIPEFPASVYETAKGKWQGFYKEDNWPVGDCTGADDLQ